MGTISRVIEDHPNFQIVEVGGHVHYSQELRLHLASLPKDEADRVIAELEHQHRIRRVVVYPFTIAVGGTSE